MVRGRDHAPGSARSGCAKRNTSDSFDASGVPVEPIVFPESLSDLSAEALDALATAARTALAELLATEHPTIAQADEAERVWAGLQSLDTETAARNAAPDRLAAVRTAFS